MECFVPKLHNRLSRTIKKTRTNPLKVLIIHQLQLKRHDRDFSEMNLKYKTKNNNNDLFNLIFPPFFCKLLEHVHV